jgi:hypothetical protein
MLRGAAPDEIASAEIGSDRRRRTAADVRRVTILVLILAWIAFSVPIALLVGRALGGRRPAG